MKASDPANENAFHKRGVASFIPTPYLLFPRFVEQIAYRKGFKNDLLNKGVHR
jgi:hypothetical protein